MRGECVRQYCIRSRAPGTRTSGQEVFFTGAAVAPCFRPGLVSERRHLPARTAQADPTVAHRTGRGLHPRTARGRDIYHVPAHSTRSCFHDPAGKDFWSQHYHAHLGNRQEVRQRTRTFRRTKTTMKRSNYCGKEYPDDSNVCAVDGKPLEQIGAPLGPQTDEAARPIAVPDATEALRDAANKDMLVGALWCGGGILVTVITYSAASGGGTYVVAWGAIIFGGIRFVRGLMRRGAVG
jgi:hypothetical protein